MVIPDWKVQELVRLVQNRYPDWQDFTHSDFVEEEVAYKQATIAKAKEWLSQKELDDLSLDEFKLDSALENHANEIAHLFAAAVSTTDPKVRVTSEKIPATDGVFNITINQIPASGSFSGQVLQNYPAEIYNQQL